MNASAARAPRSAVVMPPVRVGAAPLVSGVAPATFETWAAKDAGHLFWIAVHKSL